MDNLVPILTGSLQIFLGLTALFLACCVVGHAFALRGLKERVFWLEYEVFGCPEAEPPRKPKTKKRGDRRRKQAAGKPSQKGNGSRTSGDVEHSLVD